MPFAAFTLVFLAGLSLADQIYTDKNRYFSFMPPGQWSIVEANDDLRTKVTFNTHDASLTIIAYHPMTPASLEQMEANLRQHMKVLEETKRAHIQSIRRLNFNEYEAFELLFEVQGTQNWVLNFYLPKQIFMTVTLSAYPNVFNTRLTEAKASLNSLVPIVDRESTLGQIKNQAIGRLLNRAKTEIDFLQRYDEAESRYKEVLQLDPKNAAARSGLENLKRIRELNSGK